MPITTTTIPTATLPDLPQILDDLRVAIAGRRLTSDDTMFANSLVQAAANNVATERQILWLERLWFTHCDATPYPDDIQAGIALLSRERVQIGIREDRREMLDSIIKAVRGRMPTFNQFALFKRLVAQYEAARQEVTIGADSPRDPPRDASRLFGIFDAAAANARPGISGTPIAPRLRFPGLNVVRINNGQELLFSRPHADRARRTRLAILNRRGELLGGFAHRRSLLTEDQVALVNRLCSDPENTLATEGRRTGTCCMCARGLTDERSVNLGMGPICAARWGLSAAWLAARGEASAINERAAEEGTPTLRYRSAPSYAVHQAASPSYDAHQAFANADALGDGEYGVSDVPDQEWF